MASAPADRPGADVALPPASSRCGQSSAAPYGLAGSVAASTTTSGSVVPDGHPVTSAESDNPRSLSMTAGVENCAAPSPSMT